MTDWTPTDADYEWEIVSIDLDGLECRLRLLSPMNPRPLRMFIFDTAHFYGWKKGDHIAVHPGAMSQSREIEKTMGMRMSEEDYTLFNKRTGGKAISRKNDWAVKS
jgi:hypothetical protein